MLRNIIAALFLACAVTANAAELPDAIVLKIGVATTSSYDLVARIVQKHLGKHLPGNPRIDVETVDGGRGMQLLRQLVTTEPRDGSVLSTLVISIVHGATLDPASYDFNVGDLIWVGSLARSVSYCVTSKATPAALTDDGLIVGGANKASALTNNALLLKNLVNPSAQVVLGFKTENELMAAVDRGEIGMYCGPTPSIFEREGRGATENIVAGVGDPAVLGDYGVLDLFAGVSPADRRVLDFLQFIYRYLYSFALPAGTDPEIVKIYRDAFIDMYSDPEFIAELQSKVSDHALTDGETLQKAVADMLETDPAILARAKELLR